MIASKHTWPQPDQFSKKYWATQHKAVSPGNPQNMLTKSRISFELSHNPLSLSACPCYSDLRMPSAPLGFLSGPFSQKTDILHNHSYGIARRRRFRCGSCCKTCTGISPDSLVQPNKDACPLRHSGTGRAFATKAGYSLCSCLGFLGQREIMRGCNPRMKGHGPS